MVNHHNAPAPAGWTRPSTDGWHGRNVDGALRHRREYTRVLPPALVELRAGVPQRT